MAKIIWPSSTAPGIKPNEGGGRLINAISVKLGAGAPAEYEIKRAPGASSFADTGASGYRGGIFVDPYAFVAHEGLLKKIDNAGTVTAVDALPGTLPAFFARNNKVPTPDRVVVTENGAFVFTDSSVADLGDADLPQPNSVCAHDGYFFFTIADGRCFASGLNATTINSIDVVKAESSPDGLLRVVPYGRDILLMGQNSIEPFANTGEPTGFPYSRVTTIPIGLIGQTAVAGWENEFGTNIIFVAKNNTVQILSGGYTPQKISTPDLEALIEAETDKSLIECAVYVVGGRSVCLVSGSAFTWGFDLDGVWHERRSYLLLRSRFTGNSFYAFDRWLIGDSLSGKILQIRSDRYREDTDPLIWQAESIAMESFPTRLQVPRADFNFVTGTGIANGEDPIERQPQVEISWSDDGGRVWSTPLLCPLGPQGVDPHVFRNRLGLTRSKGRRWRLKVSDPVYVSLLHGDMQAIPRAA